MYTLYLLDKGYKRSEAAAIVVIDHSCSLPHMTQQHLFDYL